MEPVGAEIDAELRREGVLQLASDLIESKEEEDAAKGDARCITDETRATQVLKASELRGALRGARGSSSSHIGGAQHTPPSGREATLSATITGKMARLTKHVAALSCAYAKGKGVSTTLSAAWYHSVPSLSTWYTRETIGASACVSPPRFRRRTRRRVSQPSTMCTRSAEPKSAARSAGLTPPSTSIGARAAETLPSEYMPERSLGSIDATAMQSVFATNALGPVLMAQAIAPLLAKGGASPCCARLSGRFPEPYGTRVV